MRMKLVAPIYLRKNAQNCANARKNAQMRATTRKRAQECATARKSAQANLPVRQGCAAGNHARLTPPSVSLGVAPEGSQWQAACLRVNLRQAGKRQQFGDCSSERLGRVGSTYRSKRCENAVLVV
jgi:hypothetical protein